MQIKTAGGKMKKILIFLLGFVMLAQAKVIYDKDNIYIEKLDNGATLIVKERDDTKAVALQVWFGVGSVYEKDNERGLSHFLEHMLFNGTKYTKPGEIEAEIEKKGGSINAATSFDFTYYHIEIAAPFWKESLRYLYYMTTAPSLTEEMIEKEKPIVLEELNRALDNPKRLLWYKYNELAYKVSNYKYPVIGFRETIEKFNEKLVRDYFYSHYVPSNTYIVVDGNIDRDEVVKFVKETFGTVKGKYYKPPPIPLEPEQTDIRKAVLRKPQVTRAYVAIGWQAPPISSKETFPANVLEEILFGGRTSIMYQELREKGLVQAIYGGYSGYKGTSQFIVYYITDVDKKDLVKEKVFEIFKNYKENGVPEELVENAKQRLINSEVFSREEVTHDAESLGYAASVVENLDYDLKYIENIEAVTKEDVDNFLKKYIKFDAYTEVQLLPEEEEKNSK